GERRDRSSLGGSGLVEAPLEFPGVDGEPLVAHESETVALLTQKEGRFSFLAVRLEHPQQIRERDAEVTRASLVVEVWPQCGGGFLSRRARTRDQVQQECPHPLATPIAVIDERAVAPELCGSQDLDGDAVTRRGGNFD